MLTFVTYSLYSIEAIVGQNNQKVSLVVDTGSADLWIASRDCSSSPCSSSKAVLYDPSTSSPTGQTTDLTYLYVPCVAVPSRSSR
jgi:hypothetical protein